MNKKDKKNREKLIKKNANRSEINLCFFYYKFLFYMDFLFLLV